MHTGLTRLIQLRKHLPALAGGQLTPFWSGNRAVLGYMRHREGWPSLLVLCNFSECVQSLEASVFGALPSEANDLVAGVGHDLRQRLHLQPYQQLWLQLAPSDSP